MHIAPPTPAEKLKEFSLRLSQAVEEDAANWRLPAWLVAMIVAFVKEIAENLTELAKLLREGKITLQPAARQGRKRRTGKPTKRQPVPGAARVRVPRAAQAMAETPKAPGPARPTLQFHAMPAAERLATPAPRARLIAIACGPPNPLPAWDKHLSWHAHIVTMSQ